MKINRLTILQRGIALVTAGLFILSCNNDSTKDSASENEDKRADSSAMNPGITTMAKKRGKVSANMEQDNTGKKMKKDERGYYNFSEVSPSFNGGQSELESYINYHIEYPQEAIDNNVEGTVNIQFTVDEKGNVANVRTIGNKIGYGLEEEAIRVVAGMPQWNPGMISGKSVKTWRILPITYRIES